MCTETLPVFRKSYLRSECPSSLSKTQLNEAYCGQLLQCGKELLIIICEVYAMVGKKSDVYYIVSLFDF